MRLKVGDKVKCIDCSPWGSDKLSPTTVYTIIGFAIDNDSCRINDGSIKRWSVARFKLVQTRKQKLPLP